MSAIQYVGHETYRARIRNDRVRLKVARWREVTVRGDDVYFPKWLRNAVERAMRPAKITKGPMYIQTGMGI